MKVILVGTEQTGKTYAFKRLFGEKAKGYIPTVGAETGIYKNKTDIEFEVWDIAGNNKYPGLRDGYFIGADVCFFFGDDREWFRDVQRIVPTATIYQFNGYRDMKKKLDELSPVNNNILMNMPLPSRV